MQITHVDVVPVELRLKQPVQMAGLSPIDYVDSVFVRIETSEGRNAWGCGVAHQHLTGETVEHALPVFQACADVVVDLHPTNIEYSLSELAPIFRHSPAAACAFDLAFHDLLGLAAGIPLYRLLGGFRQRIQTSVTIPITSVQQSVDLAKARASQGFRMLKVKGGLDPDGDVRRVQAIHRALPSLILRLDADGGYSVAQSIDVARALQDELEMLEQPTPADDMESLQHVTMNSPVKILADQSVKGPETALQFAAQRTADGLSVKMAACGGLRCAKQIDSIARAAKMSVMVSCLIEPALLIAAGLSFALSSPGVHYCDLDGHLELINDPVKGGFVLQEGWLVSTEVPGLGCTVALD